jgi:hypothetical protein
VASLHVFVSWGEGRLYILFLPSVCKKGNIVQCVSQFAYSPFCGLSDAATCSCCAGRAVLLQECMQCLSGSSSLSLGEENSVLICLFVLLFWLKKCGRSLCNALGIYLCMVGIRPPSTHHFYYRAKPNSSNGMISSMYFLSWRNSPLVHSITRDGR